MSGYCNDFNDVNLAEELARKAVILKAIAHPLRLGIVHLLEKHGELSVGQLFEMLDCEQSLASHHLKNMKEKGILQMKSKGRTKLYSLKEMEVINILNCLENCQHG